MKIHSNPPILYHGFKLTWKLPYILSPFPISFIYIYVYKFMATFTLTFKYFFFRACILNFEESMFCNINCETMQIMDHNLTWIYKHSPLFLFFFYCLHKNVCSHVNTNCMFIICLKCIFFFFLKKVYVVIKIVENCATNGSWINLKITLYMYFFYSFYILLYYPLL